MPKQLLLMETHEKLMEASDLFNKLDKLLQVLMKTKYKVMLIGSSVKELDLVEAFIMGRDLCYKRYSGMSLYEPQELTDKLQLYLVTRQQLLTGVDLIISLDAGFKVHSSIPLIDFVSIQSPTHGLMKYDKDTATLNFLVKRTEDFTQVYKPFGEVFEALNPLNFSNWPMVLPEFQTFSQGEILDSLYSKDEKKIKMDYHEYKKLLTQFTLERLEHIHKLIYEKNQQLKPLRLRSMLYHNQWDQEKLNIGTMFKESMKLKDETTGNEQKLERLTLEYQKYEENLDALSMELEYLNKLENGEETVDDEVLDKEIEELQANLDSITKENDAEYKMDALRSQYQKITSTAAEKSVLASSLKKQNDEFVQKLTGMGSILRQQSQTKQQERMDLELRKAHANLNFLKSHNEKLSQLVKERVSTLSVGRNGRLHRSTTPYV
jgi:hypothetical protein